MMGWKEVLEHVKKEEQFLDTLDLEPLIRQETRDGKSVDDIVRIVEDTYLEEYQKIHPDAEFVLNYMTNDEFASYIMRRYHMTCREEVITYFNC